MAREWEDAPMRDMFNREPVCPHCHEPIDTADLRPNCNNEEEVDCPTCGKRLLIEFEYEVTYTTRKPKEPQATKEGE